jgi:hypothetical protein
VGKTGTFTLQATDSDLLGFQWSLNFQDLPPVDVNSPFFAPAVGGVATIRATPPRTGRNDLYVRAVDKAWNVSPVYQKSTGTGFLPGGFGFGVGSAVPPPVAHWPLDGTGTMAAVPDVSGGARPATVTGLYPASSAAWVAGRVDDAMRFNANTDGTSGGFAVTAGTPVVNTAGTFAVSTWVNLDRADGFNHAALSQNGNQVSGFSLGYEGDTRRFAFKMFPQDTPVAPVRAMSASAPTTGAWTHLVGMYDAGAKQLRLYVNGVLDGTATLMTPWTSNGAVQIGRNWYGGHADAYWPGLVDDAQVWNRLLSDAEVQALAATPALEEAFYPLDEGAGTRAGDESGNYRTGTGTGGASWAPGTVGTGALLLDGVDDAVTTSTPAVRTDTSFTVSARVVLGAANGSTQTVVSQDGPNASGFALQYQPNGSSGRWVMRVAPSDGAVPITATSTAAPVPGQWVFVAGVYDATQRQVRLYVGSNEYVAPGRVTANVVGNLVIGRAKQAGAATAFFGGRVDDVHVWTGVRGKEDLTADQLSLATSRPTPFTGQLSRYFGHGGRHWVTSGPVPPGTAFEIGLGQLATPGSPDTRMIYSCMYPGGQYVTAKSGCETSDSTLLGQIGLLYMHPQADVPTIAVYRCVLDNGDHFVAIGPDCEGHTSEGLIGYAQAYRALIRYVRMAAPYDHFTSVTGRTGFNGGPAYTYRPEGRLGLVAMTTEAGQRPLYACVDGADEFLATSAACDGKQQRYWSGNIWASPPAFAQESVQLMGCRAGTPTGEWFASTDEACEQQSTVGALGYLITRL